jgi:hypothetical protein
MMKKLLSAKLAGRILIGAFILMLIMHVLVLTGVMPSILIWGGQVAADGSNLLQLEIVAISLTLIFTGIAAGKMKQLKTGQSNRWINIGVWIVFAYLVLNTLGNFASGVSLETLVFGPLTIIMAFCALRLAIEKQDR